MGAATPEWGANVIDDLMRITLRANSGNPSTVAYRVRHGTVTPDNSIAHAEKLLS